MQLGSIPQQQCPCVSPGIWLLSSVCSHPAGPQSDEHDSLPFFFSSLSLHNALSSLSLPVFISIPSCFCLRCTVSSRDTEKDTGSCIAIHLCTWATLFHLLPPLSEPGPVGCMSCITGLFCRAPQFLSPEQWYCNDSSPRGSKQLSFSGDALGGNKCLALRLWDCQIHWWLEKKHGGKY